MGQSPSIQIDNNQLAELIGEAGLSLRVHMALVDKLMAELEEKNHKINSMREKMGRGSTLSKAQEAADLLIELQDERERLISKVTGGGWVRALKKAKLVNGLRTSIGAAGAKYLT